MMPIHAKLVARTVDGVLVKPFFIDTLIFLTGYMIADYRLTCYDAEHISFDPEILLRRSYKDDESRRDF